jgi:predicted DNA-binding WGR domain protein
MYRIVLRAVDPARNVYREYELSCTRDLLGDLVLETKWGRIGATGLVRRQTISSVVEARQIVRRLLQRRAGAIGRVGVPYRVISETGSL